ncbi:MAG: hypothetical protein HYV20_01110 [Gemmatimonadetes bacterium]|nr:hypothetical protein [Gemmatimonadota bacterium]
MKTLKLMAILPMVPALLGAQQDAVVRLREVLPSEVAEQVLATVEDATASGLPGRAIAALALEGVAKGRSGEQVVAAARELRIALGAAHQALQQGTRTPAPGEIEAGATAMRLGVEGPTVSALASTAPSGRSLVVPLVVMASLADRGLPSDQALGAVHARLEAWATDADLLALPGEVGELLAAGLSPSEVGRTLAAERIGFSVPVAGLIQWAGPPAGVPVNGGTSIPRPTPPVPPPPPVRLPTP